MSSKYNVDVFKIQRRDDGPLGSDTMIHEISYLVYGGQPRNVLHSSSDVVELERQAMMKWASSLKAFGKYDEYISAGGISWIDMPTASGRRLLLRVFATQGESRDGWYFLGLLLSEKDYERIRDYGSLVSFVESFTLENLLSDRVPGSKMIVNFEHADSFSGGMPPLFRQSTNSDWTTANWIQTRAKRVQHIDGSQLSIAFNPPKARSEYTALLLSGDFPLQGLRLKPNAGPTDSQESSDEKKKKSRFYPSLPAILSMLMTAFVIGYFVRLSTQPSKSFVKTSVVANDNGLLQPKIRLQRIREASFVFVVEGEEVMQNQISVRSSEEWLKVGTPKQRNNRAIEYPCRIELSESDSINATQSCSLVVVRDGETVSECVVEIEAADITTSLQLESEVEPMARPGDGKKIRGLVAARHGIASVFVNNAQVDLEISAEGTLGSWCSTVESSSESVSITVFDRNENQLITVEKLPE